MQVAIVKYNAGNIYSVDCALRRVGIEPILTDDKETLMTADKVIFPGVGEAATTDGLLAGSWFGPSHLRLETTRVGYLHRHATHVSSL